MQAMRSPSDMPEPATAGWIPEEPVGVPPLLQWPPRPKKILGYMFGFPGFYFPWIALYALFALALWAALVAVGAELKSFSLNWIAPLVAFNLLLAIVVYGLWHHRLYSRRAQGTRFKYNPRWLADEDKKFLFGRPTASNVFWTLGSGVPIWSAYAVVTLWAQARGIAPTTTWAQSPIYCTALMFALPFFHAVHFYVFHRAIHWAPLYNTVHYLHHKNVNTSPWSGLAMHPVEHLIYFSGALLLWVIPSTPMHVLFLTTVVGLAPVHGHTGFGKVVLGRYTMDADNYFHYLHHKFFTVNYGDPLLIPLDRLFGSFHDGTRRNPVARHVGRGSKDT
jgi:sterol desaturase/sphingolipid hydroxylase (fatty acid hydroxylase superfamily)